MIRCLTRFDAKVCHLVLPTTVVMISISVRRLRSVRIVTESKTATPTTPLLCTMTTKKRQKVFTPMMISYSLPMLEGAMPCYENKIQRLAMHPNSSSRFWKFRSDEQEQQTPKSFSRMIQMTLFLPLPKRLAKLRPRRCWWPPPLVRKEEKRTWK